MPPPAFVLDAQPLDRGDLLDRSKRSAPACITFSPLAQGMLTDST